MLDGAVDKSVVLPGWVLPALATAMVTVAGAGFTVWNNSSIHETRIATNSKINDRQEAQIEKLQADLYSLRGEVERLKNEQTDFQYRAIEKLDTVLERDRFRRR